MYVMSFYNKKNPFILSRLMRQVEMHIHIEDAEIRLYICDIGHNLVAILLSTPPLWQVAYHKPLRLTCM